MQWTPGRIPSCFMTESKDIEPSLKWATPKKVAVSTVGKLACVSLVARCQISPLILSFWFCVPSMPFDRRLSSLRASKVGRMTFATASGIGSLCT